MNDAQRPAEVFPPGEYIKDELEARGWNQTDLANIIGRKTAVVNELISGKRGITRQSAIELGDAFGTGPDFWMNLEASYRLGHIEQGQTVVARRALVYARAPIREMIRRHWIEDTKDVGLLEKRVAAFFGQDSLDEEPADIPFAARRAEYGVITPALRAWLYRVRQVARGAQTAVPFSDHSFARALQRLATLRANAPDTRQIARVLADNGIRLVVIEHLAGTKIDGTCCWLDDQSPVIAISLRFDRLDWFWFTLIHEMCHVKRRDGLGPNSYHPVDVDMVGDGSKGANRPPEEDEADRFAVEFLVPQDQIQNFINRVDPLFSRQSILGFAARIGVHPALVVGQLAWRGKISYSHSRDLLAKSRHYVTETALTDGWGHVIAA